MVVILDFVLGYLYSHATNLLLKRRPNHAMHPTPTVRHSGCLRTPTACRPGWLIADVADYERPRSRSAVV